MTTLTEHLLDRHYDLNRYPTQWVTETTLTVPLFGFNHALVGYQVYTPNAPKKAANPKEAKYFTRLNGKVGVFGLEIVLQPGPVFLTESVFKSASLHSLGLNSWAMLTSTLSPQLTQQLKLLPYDFVCLGDDDKAGLEFSKTLGRGTTSKDLDELTTEERWAVVKGFL